MNVHQYAEALEEFNKKLFVESINQSPIQDGNIVLSALSASMIMSMLAVGAQGKTKKELCDALCIKDMNEAILAIKKTIAELVNTKGVTLQLANKIYVKQVSPYLKCDSAKGLNRFSNAISPMYRSIVEDIFKSEIQEIDFSNGDQAATKINAWVEAKTSGIIKNIVAASMFTPSTRAVLINAIYFKGAWAKSFNSTYTRREHFYPAVGSTAKVDMMNLTYDLYYNEIPELDAKIISLPYKNWNLSMVIILPNSINGIEDIERIIASNAMCYIRNARKREVVLKLPKFKTATTVNMRRVLKNLGVNCIFSEEAELGGISGGGELFISDIIQAAFIEVNEEGTEAAACTSALVYDCAELDTGINYFTADHPFYYEIVYNRRPLFNGIFRGP